MAPPKLGFRGLRNATLSAFADGTHTHAVILLLILSPLTLSAFADGASGASPCAGEREFIQRARRRKRIH